MKYFQIEIKLIKEFNKDIHFDLYVKLSDKKYVRVYNKENDLDQDILGRFERKNIENLYVKENDYEVFSQELEELKKRLGLKAKESS